jgi:hypothetical protein
VQQIYDVVEGRDKRNELNLYISGYDDEEEHPEHAAHSDIATPLTVPDAGAPESGADPEEPLQPDPGAEDLNPALAAEAEASPDPEPNWTDEETEAADEPPSESETS